MNIWYKMLNHVYFALYACECTHTYTSWRHSLSIRTHFFRNFHLVHKTQRHFSWRFQLLGSMNYIGIRRALVDFRVSCYVWGGVGFPGSSVVKNPPAKQEIRGQSLSWEDLEKQMATQSRILAWEILWREEPGGLQSMGRKESDTH